MTAQAKEILLDNIKDKIKGCIYGQAIGDALGLGTEFMTRAEVKRHYPNGLERYDPIIQDYHRQRWQRGEWTDDTDMMLCIAKASHDNHFDIETIAHNFKNWFNGCPSWNRFTYKQRPGIWGLYPSTYKSIAINVEVVKMHRSRKRRIDENIHIGNITRC